MLSMDEELKAAVAAKAAIDMQSTAPLSSATITILREAIRAVTPATMFLSEKQLTEARREVVITLSDDQAKSAVEDWLKRLREASSSYSV
jgi:precorrin-4 methylase